MALLALLAATAGLGLFALGMPRHWRQVCGGRSCPTALVSGLRIGGTFALLISLLLCLQRDHPTMAVLVWVMNLAVGAIVVALLLAWLSAKSTPMGNH